VPDGAPLAALKRAAIRALRFLWRNQSSSTRSLTAGSAISDSVDRFRAEASRRIDELARARRRPGVAPDAGGAADGRGQGSAGPRRRDTERRAPRADIPPGVYALFEERFRGSADEISRAQRFYLDSLRGVPGRCSTPAAAAASCCASCGPRGSAAWASTRTPSRPALRAEGLARGGRRDRARSRRARPPRSGRSTAFQLVEHWPPAGVFRFLQAARAALAPGGVLVAETINADSLSALRAFYLDPTHVRRGRRTRCASSPRRAASSTCASCSARPSTRRGGSRRRPKTTGS
jgi:hypothetical protein